MKYQLIAALILLSSVVYADPTSTKTYVDGGDARVNLFVRLSSHHKYHLQNMTGTKQIYHLTMNLCATDKNECNRFKTVLGLEHGQQIDWAKDLHLDTIYKNIGEHAVNASTIVENVPEATSGDQKYVWIHY